MQSKERIAERDDVVIPAAVSQVEGGTANVLSWSRDTSDADIIWCVEQESSKAMKGVPCRSDAVRRGSLSSPKKSDEDTGEGKGRLSGIMSDDDGNDARWEGDTDSEEERVR